MTQAHFQAYAMDAPKKMLYIENRPQISCTIGKQAFSIQHLITEKLQLLQKQRKRGPKNEGNEELEALLFCLYDNQHSWMS